MKHLRLLILGIFLSGLGFGVSVPAHALAGSPGGLSIDTTYPSMVVGIGETVNLSMDLRSASSQVVSLDVVNLPKDWIAEFRGDGRVVRSVYVTAGSPSSVELRITAPETAKAGTYDFSVVAKDSNETATFPIEFLVKDKAPARLTFATDYPTIRGGSDAAFNLALR